MSYDFVDVIGAAPSVSLPTEAMSWNGNFLEHLVPGYRTLYVKGREAYDVDISYNEVANRDGAFYNRRRFPPRPLTVGFQLLCADSEAFREAYNDLFAALYVEQAEIIFNDELEFYFTGTVQSVPPPKPGMNKLVGEIQILCVDPYKHSITETVIMSEAEYHSSGFSGFKARTYAVMDLPPRFEFDFANDCGYLALENLRTGAKIVVGDEELADNMIVELLSHPFPNAASITSDFVQGSGVLTSLGEYQAKLQSGAHYDNAYANGTDATKYGKGIRVRTTTEAYSGFYGGSITYNFQTELSSVVYTWEHYLVATAAQSGFHVLSLDDANGVPLVAVEYYKGPNERSQIMNCDIVANIGTASYIKSMTVSSAEKNEYTGSGKYTGTVVAPTSFGRGIGQIQFITVDEYTVHVMVNIGGMVRVDEVLVSETPVPKAAAVRFTSGRYGETAYLNQNRLLSISVESSDSIFYARPIQAGDLLEIDTESGDIKINGELRYDLGSLGNNFSGMALAPMGENDIQMTYSSWYDGRPVGRCYWRQKQL